MKQKWQWLMPIVAIASTASAEPTLYPKDLSVLSAITNSTNSNILADSSDAKTVWVLPPNTASAQVRGLHSRTANMAFCAEMRDLKDYSREISGEINDLMRQRKAKQADLDKLQRRANELAEDAEKFAVDRGLEALSSLDTRIQAANDRLSELYRLADSCRQGCELIEQEAANLVAAKNVMLQQRNELVQQKAEDAREYTRRLRLAEAARKTFTDARGSYMELVGELTQVQNTFRETFASFGKMEGARAAIIYKSNWDDNVKKLRMANPGINFAQVATKNATLMTEIAGIHDVDPQGAVKSIALGGVVGEGAARFAQYPPSLSTNVVLSLIGACPMEHPEYFDLPANSSDEMQYGIIITYDYDSIFEAKAKVTYNMYKMYEKIVSSGSSGGLFSSRSWTNVEEREFFRDSFSVEWFDEENTIPQAQKDAKESEMRRAVLLRLATLALPNSPNRADVLAAAQPPTRGAVVVSDSLMQTCPGNVYCMGAAVVFRVLDAIFGSSSSTASYRNITDVSITENYQQTQKITKAWITSYL